GVGRGSDERARDELLGALEQDVAWRKSGPVRSHGRGGARRHGRSAAGSAARRRLYGGHTSIRFLLPRRGIGGLDAVQTLVAVKLFAVLRLVGRIAARLRPLAARFLDLLAGLDTDGVGSAMREGERNADRCGERGEDQARQRPREIRAGSPVSNRER